MTSPLIDIKPGDWVVEHSRYAISPRLVIRVSRKTYCYFEAEKIRSDRTCVIFAGDETICTRIAAKLSASRRLEGCEIHASIERRRERDAQIIASAGL